jgi:2-polyprenyl-3-methyl-5-hydroxy-6-metoxy-1,4-benzoquinol methylase
MIQIGKKDNSWTFLPELPPPEPWGQNQGIPWNDPGFSRRILQEHLDPNHDKASRRPVIIDVHTEWIHNDILKGRYANILDIGCGPGLYTSRLASKGHRCTGIDYSPSSIEYARKSADQTNNTCEYYQSDLRSPSDYRFHGPPYDLIICLYAEFCTFSPDDAALILNKCRNAMTADGYLILEMLTPVAVYEMGCQMPCRTEYTNGVFSDMPHQVLEEYFWNPHKQAAVVRYRIIHQNNSVIQTFVQTYQAWRNEVLMQLFNQAGFTVHRTYPLLGNIPDDNDDDFLTYVLGLSAEGLGPRA